MKEAGNSGEVSMRQMQRSVIPSVAALQLRICPEMPTWTAEELEQHLEVFPEGHLVAVDESGGAGFGQFIAHRLGRLFRVGKMVRNYRGRQLPHAQPAGKDALRGRYGSGSASAAARDRLAFLRRARRNTAGTSCCSPNPSQCSCIRQSWAYKTAMQGQLSPFRNLVIFGSRGGIDRESDLEQ